MSENQEQQNTSEQEQNQSQEKQNDNPYKEDFPNKSYGDTNENQQQDQQNSQQQQSPNQSQNNNDTKENIDNNNSQQQPQQSQNNSQIQNNDNNQSQQQDQTQPEQQSQQDSQQNQEQNQEQNSQQQQQSVQDPILESQQASMQNSKNNYEQQQENKQFTENQEQQIEKEFKQSYQKLQESNNYQGFGEIKTTNIFFHHNQRLLNNFFENNKDEFYKYFKDFSQQNSTENNDKIQVSGSDIPLIARVGFYLDNITFHESKEDKEELFQKTNSYKKVLFQLSEFLELKNIPYEDINMHKLDFQFFLDFITYFVNTDPDIYLKQNDQTDYSGDNKTQEDLEKPQEEEGLIGEIKRSIEKYQAMLEVTTDPKESQIILGTIEALQEQLNNLLRPPTLPSQSFINQSFSKQNTTFNKSRLSYHTKEVRARNLRFLFNFYCSQKYAAGQGHTFDRIMREKNALTLGKLTLFCKQFSIYNQSPQLTKKDIPSIFKKVTNNAKDLKEAEFKIFLEKVALAMFENKEEDFPTDFDKIEAFYKFICIDDINAMKLKCKIISQPFNIQEEDGFRLLPRDKNREIKVHKIDPRKLEELKQKKIHDKQKMLTNMEYKDHNTSKISMMNSGGSKQIDWSKGGNVTPQQNKSKINRSQLNKSPNQSFQLNNANKFKYTYENYADRKVKNQESNIRQKQTFSWGELEKYTYEDMKQYQPGTFKPQDLFDENEDEEDKFYLKEYTLEQEKKDKQIQQEKQVHNVENYGKIQEKLRPTQKYLLRNDPSYDPSQRYYQTNTHKNHKSHNDFYGLKQQPQTQQQPRYNLTTNNQMYYLPQQQQLQMQQQPQGPLTQNPMQRHSSQGRITTNNVLFGHQHQQQNQQYNTNIQNSNNISQQYLKRADQLDGYAKVRQQQQMDRLVTQQQRKSQNLKIKY